MHNFIILAFPAKHGGGANEIEGDVDRDRGDGPKVQPLRPAKQRGPQINTLHVHSQPHILHSVCGF